MKLRRYGGNPILKPLPQNAWESETVLNPAAIYDHELFHLLYRAMGRDGISRIGYAVSTDGFNFFRFNKPVFTPKLIKEPRGCEDPRVVKIENKYYMTYTAYSEKGTRIGIARTTNFLEWERYRVEWKDCKKKDAVLFPDKIGGKYVLLHRPMDVWPMGFWIAYSDNLTDWNDLREIIPPLGKGTWEGEKIGACAPPIKMEKGWLLIYQGVDENDTYRLGAAILCLDDHTKLLYRFPEPILEPEMYYEIRGEVPRVVFAGGACEVKGRVNTTFTTVRRIASFASLPWIRKRY